MPESETPSISLRDVILYTGMVERVNGEVFKESKRRPAVVIWKHEKKGEEAFFAAPLNSSTGEVWRGPNARSCIFPSGKHVDYSAYMTKEEVEKFLRSDDIDFNNLEKVSQVAISNVFLVRKENLYKKIGRIDSIDYATCKEMFFEYLKWLDKEKR